MAFEITKDNWREILGWAERHPAVEVTGVVVGIPGKPRDHRVRPLVNHSRTPETDFQWGVSDTRQMLAGLDRSETVIAIYHSHPTRDPIPSEVDMLAAAWIGAHYIIVTPDGRGKVYECPEMGMLIEDDLVLL